MGLTIRKNEIVDGLLRRYFPPPFQALRYKGARAGTENDQPLMVCRPPESCTDGVGPATLS
jgi:hypothetical protein